MAVARQLQSVPLPEPPSVLHALKDGKRLDGREDEEFRVAFMQTKSVSQAAGSAYVELDKTKVMAAVYGPRQSERKLSYQDVGRLNCEVRLTSFASSSKPRAGQASCLDKDLSQVLQQALTPAVMLHTFPKAVVDVHCMLLCSGGSDAAAIIVAASLALADAGIQMYDLVPACCVSLLDGHLLLDPSQLEHKKEEGQLLLASLPVLGQVTQLSVSGVWSKQQWRDALELAMAGCAQLRAIMRQTLLDAVGPGT